MRTYSDQSESAFSDGLSTSAWLKPGNEASKSIDNTDYVLSMVKVYIYHCMSALGEKLPSTPYMHSLDICIF